jgi:hypothetical protein
MLVQLLPIASQVCSPVSRPFAEFVAFRRARAKPSALANPAFTLKTHPRELALTFG